MPKSVIEPLLLLVLVILAASHVYVQNYDSGSAAVELLRQYLEAVTLAMLIVAGAMFGAHFGRSLSRRTRSAVRPTVIEPLLLLVLVILAASHVYVQNYDSGSAAVELLRQYLEAVTLAMLIVAGAMFGAHFGRSLSRRTRSAVRPTVIEPLLLLVLVILAASHVYVQNYDSGSAAVELLRQYLEAVTLAMLIVAGAMFGAHFGRSLSRRTRSAVRPTVIEPLLLLVLVILAASHVYVQNYDSGSAAVELLRQYLEAVTLAMLIVAGAMFGAHFGRSLSRRTRSAVRPTVIEMLGMLALGVLVALHVYAQNHDGSAAVGMWQYVEATTLGALIVAGAVLGAHYSRRPSGQARPAGRIS